VLLTHEIGCPEDGAFGEIITAKGDIQIHIPDNMSFEEAATLGVGISTVGQGLYQSISYRYRMIPKVSESQRGLRS
jgi:NADPH:quinone reductase-like Zn-dependent oxidoreductase